MITQEEARRYKEALEEIHYKAVKLYPNAFERIEAIEKISAEALSLKVEMEEVEVVRWQCQACSMYGTPIDKNDKVCGNCGKPEVVKLQGTYSRPKKRKVLRREYVGCNDLNVLYFTRPELMCSPLNGRIPKNVMLYAEWEEEV